MRITKIVALALAGSSLGSIAGTAQAQDPGAAEDENAIIVLGSRIPRVQIEGPAPVSTISSDEILKNGYQDVADVLRAITQNGGETQSPQGYADAEFTPGAQQVDLRGLGPGHTLVLVNGRRIADFPLPYGGNSNFTDITNIPVGLIERVEVLSGSASAIYGSDAIAGVVNFQLKSRPDGTRIDLRGGLTEHGGGESARLTISSGFESGAFRALFGAELSLQEPLWMYERKFQDSSADDPTEENPIARRNFLRTSEYFDEYLDPGQAVCDTLSDLNFGTNYYAARPEYGYDIINDEYIDGRYCGSNEAMGYGTMVHERRAITGYAALAYEIGDDTELFLDAQASYSRLKQFKDVLEWWYVTPDGNEDGTFFNPNLAPELTYSGDQLDNWYRLFTPEEMGGFDKGMIRNRSFAYNITPGVRGKFGDKWGYELSFNRAEYNSRISWREVLIEESNDLFLGPQMGFDPDTGYPIFDADVNRLYTPLTPQEFDSITAVSTYRPKTWVNNLAATINTTELFELPAGPVGFAVAAELGSQGYQINPDPLALTQYYLGILDSDGAGTRKHFGAGGELRIPVLSVLTLEGAGRYDHYSYAGRGIDKFTYNIGAELRPVNSLLIRAAYGTGFRAPDLHYVFKGPGNKDSSGTDYYLCRDDDPAASYSDCEGDWDFGFFSRHQGNLNLEPETSTSLNAGFFFQPTRNISFSADYFRVKMKNQVLNLSIDSVLRDEADCLLGVTPDGDAVDPSSPTCLDAIDRVERYTSGVNDGLIYAVAVNPINIAEETTDGVDVALNISVPTESAGEFSLSVGYTYVFNHTSRQYPGDPIENQLAFDSGFYIPRDKGSASLSWTKDRFTTTFSGQRLGRLPNWDEDAFLRPTYLFNLSAQYRISDNLQLSGTVTNLFDKEPAYDPTHGSYPYYNSSWYDGIGREFYLQLTYKMGGAPL